MAVRHFDCEDCGAHGQIKFKESSDFRTSDICYCPFCGCDIYEDEEVFEDEDEE